VAQGCDEGGRRVVRGGGMGCGRFPLAPSAMGNRSHGWSERGLYAAEQVPSDGDNLHLIGAGIDL